MIGDVAITALDLSPGIRDWLDRARRLGLRLGVASSSPRDWVTRLLATTGCLDRFEIMACGDEVGAPKPDPAVYSMAIAGPGQRGGPDPG
ncbi:MAG TPA: HAD family hydrolase [Pseudonocardiaceae bacterium]|jgi:putative hydrolase of the HAD superfamily|nr:HAD family hydrolase [Pseudonocardiaceae bacterium]